MFATIGKTHMWFLCPTCAKNLERYLLKVSRSQNKIVFWKKLWLDNFFSRLSDLYLFSQYLISKDWTFKELHFPESGFTIPRL